MKRSAPLKRRGFLKRKSRRLPAKSKQRKASDAKSGPERERYKEKHCQCMWPGCHRPSEHVHEILYGRQYRHITSLEPCFWLALCAADPSTGEEGCHAKAHRVGYPEALAVKLLSGTEYDLERFCEVWGGTIEASEVAAFVAQIRKGRAA